jgi:hypothetical protein
MILSFNACLIFFERQPCLTTDTEFPFFRTFPRSSCNFPGRGVLSRHNFFSDRALLGLDRAVLRVSGNRQDFRCKNEAVMNKSTMALLSLFFNLVAASHGFAQDVCADLFKQGYYDQHNTFSDQRSFKYVQATICSDTTLTKQQSQDRNLGSGGSYYQVITGFLNLGDQQKSFEEQRSIFCSMTLDTASANAVFIQTSRTVSQAATSVMKTCLERQGFHAAIVPSRNPASFAILTTYHGDGVTDIHIDKISANPAITCDLPANSVVHSGANILCGKDADQTVQVAMNTDKGSLAAIDVLGTKDINVDTQGQLQILADQVAELGRPTCIGCIEQSVLTEAQFQTMNGSAWVLCDGRSIVGTRLAQATGVSNAPNLLGEFLRGKNFGRYSDVEEVDLGTAKADTVGPHTHRTRNLDDRPQNPLGESIFWDGGKRFSDGTSVFVQSETGNPETRPKNVTVNFFCKVN